MDLDILDRFYYKMIRRILHISMNEVKENKITNGEMRKKFGSIPKLSNLWRTRMLKFIDRTVRQDINVLLISFRDKL